MNVKKERLNVRAEISNWAGNFILCLNLERTFSTKNKTRT